MDAFSEQKKLQKNNENNIGENLINNQKTGQDINYQNPIHDNQINDNMINDPNIPISTIDINNKHILAESIGLNGDKITVQEAGNIELRQQAEENVVVQQAANVEVEKYNRYDFARQKTIENVWKNMPADFKNIKSSQYTKRKNQFNIMEASISALKSDEEYLEGHKTDDIENVKSLINTISALNIKYDNIKKDKDLVKNARSLEILCGRLAALDEKTALAQYRESLTERDRSKFDARLNKLRQIAAYYIVKKEMLTSPVYVNSDNTISMELTGEERPERVAYVKRMMIASHLESVLSGKEKNPNLNSDVSATMYETSGMYRQVEACSELITSYRSELKEKQADGTLEEETKDMSPVELDDAMKLHDQLKEMPQNTEAERKAYDKKQRKYLKSRKDGIIKYIDNIEDSQKVKLSKQEKEYLKLLAEVSYAMDINMNGLHSFTTLPYIYERLDKIKNSPCYKRHENIIPSFLKRELQIGSTEKLNKLISDYEEQKVDLDLTDMHKEGSFYSFKSAYGDGYNIAKHKYEMYSVKGQSHLFLDRLIAGSRMMEYMGLGKDVLKSDLVYIKDNKGKFNIGRKWYQKLGQYHLWMEKIREDKQGREEIVYSPDAIRTISNMAIMNALLGSENINMPQQLNYMYSDVDLQKRSLYMGGPSFSSVANKQFVSGVYMLDVGVTFTKKTSEDLKKGYEGVSAFKSMDIPLLDKEFVDKVMNLKVEDIYKITGGLVSKEDVRYFSDRLAYIKGLLQKRIDADAKLSDNEKTILTREEWNKRENAERIEEKLQGNNPQFYPELFGEHIEIQGASHKFKYEAKDKKDEKQNQAEQKSESEYNRLYYTIRDEFLNQKTDADKVDFLLKIYSCSFFASTRRINHEAVKSLVFRVFGEYGSKSLFVAYNTKKLKLLKKIYDLVEAKLKDPDLKVPEVYTERIKKENQEELNKKLSKLTEDNEKEDENKKTEEDLNKEREKLRKEYEKKTEIKLEKLKKEYAATEVRRENLDVYAEALIYQETAGEFSATGFSTLNTNHENSLPELIFLEDTWEYKTEYKEKTNSGNDYLEMMGEPTLMYPVRAERSVLRNKIFDECGEKYEALYEKYGLINTDIEPDLERKLEVMNGLITFGLAKDVKGSLDYIKKHREEGDPDIEEIVKDYNRYLDSNKDMDTRLPVFDVEYIKTFKVEFKKMEDESKKENKDERDH